MNILEVEHTTQWPKEKDKRTNKDLHSDLENKKIKIMKCSMS
jgi:hypothetical protein